MGSGFGAFNKTKRRALLKKVNNDLVNQCRWLICPMLDVDYTAVAANGDRFPDQSVLSRRSPSSYSGASGRLSAEQKAEALREVVRRKSAEGALRRMLNTEIIIARAIFFSLSRRRSSEKIIFIINGGFVDKHASALHRALFRNAPGGRAIRLPRFAARSSVQSSNAACSFQNPESRPT